MPFGVAHDARDQDAGLGRVEVADRQAHHVRLHALAHVGDGALRRHAEDLRERERGHRLHERGGAGRQRDRHEQIGAVLPDHFVDELLGRRRQHQAGQAADEHKDQADRQPAPVRPEQLARLAPGVGGRHFFLPDGLGRRCGPRAVAPSVRR